MYITFSQDYDVTLTLSSWTNTSRWPMKFVHHPGYGLLHVLDLDLGYTIFEKSLCHYMSASLL